MRCPLLVCKRSASSFRSVSSPSGRSGSFQDVSDPRAPSPTKLYKHSIHIPGLMVPVDNSDNESDCATSLSTYSVDSSMSANPLRRQTVAPKMLQNGGKNVKRNRAGSIEDKQGQRQAAQGVAFVVYLLCHSTYLYLLCHSTYLYLLCHSTYLYLLCHSTYLYLLCHSTYLYLLCHSTYLYLLCHSTYLYLLCHSTYLYLLCHSTYLYLLCHSTYLYFDCSAFVGASLLVQHKVH